MIIEYGCVKLRAIEEKDADLLFYLINDPEIEKRVAGWNLPISSIEQTNWIKSYKNTSSNIRLMIELSNGATIGMISLTDIDMKNRTAAINYKIESYNRNRIKNDMHDAIIGILTYAFDELGLETITSTILADNVFSLKLARKMGFVEEGRLRKRIYKCGEHKDQIVTSLLKNEFYRLYKLE